MKYFHRTHTSLPEMLGLARRVLRRAAHAGAGGAAPAQFAGAIGKISVTVQAEGGHYTLVTVETDQVGESEADKLAKRFLTVAHAATHPSHRPIGAY